MTQAFPFLFALALTIPFVGKGLIGVMMVVMVIASLPFLVKKCCFWNAIKAKEAWIMLALSVSWCASGYLGLNPDKAVSEWAQHSGMMIGGVLIYGGLSRVEFSFEAFYRWCGLFATGFAIVILGNIMMPFLPDEFISNSYGSVLALLMPFLLYHAVTTQNISSWLSVFLTMIAVFALGGRTGWAVLSLVTVLSVIFFPWKGIARRHIMRGLCVGLLVISGAVGVKLYEQSVDTVMYESRVSGVTMDRPASGRLDIWGETLQSVDENPWFGLGIKGFRELDLTKGPLHAHNTILEVLIDTGFVGLALLSALIVLMVGRFVKYYWQAGDAHLSALFMPILLSCVAYGTASMALTSFFHAWWFLYCVALLILLRLATDRLKNSVTG